MSTRSLQIFDDKIRVLKQHLQLSDLALTMANKACTKAKGNKKKIYETLGAKPNTHTQLNHPNEEIDIKRTFITSRNKLNEQAIVDLYGLFSLYIYSLVKELSHKDPKKILGLMSNKTESSLKYPEIIDLGSYDAIIDEMASRIYRSLEDERSTPKLLQRFINFTKMQIATDLKDDALLYLEIRHLIIHNSSKTDAKFIKMNKEDKVKIKKNNKIDLCYDLSNTAINKIFELCHKIDGELVRLKLL